MTVKLFSIIFCAIIFLGCNILSPTKITPRTLIANTPTNLLILLKEAYIYKDLILYESLLSDSFIFYADANVENFQTEGFRITYDTLTGSPVYYWSKEEEISRHKKMFDIIDGAENISLSFTATENMWEQWIINDSIIGMQTKDKAINDISLNLTYLGSVYEFSGGISNFKVKKSHKTGFWQICEWYDLGAIKQ